MSAVCVIAPVVISSWPTIVAAVAAAAATAGFRVDARAARADRAARERREGQEVELPLENARIVGESLGHDDRIVVERDGVRVTFERDARGTFRACVEGNGTKEELRSIGEDLAGRVIQQYAYRRLAGALQENGFTTISEEEGKDQSIRLRVRAYRE